MTELICHACTLLPHLRISLGTNGPRQANLVLIAYASCEGSGEPAHPRSLARTFAARSYKQWIKRNFQTENQIPGPSEWLDMRSWNLSWRNARRHKFAWRGSNADTICHFPRSHCIALLNVIYFKHLQTLLKGTLLKSSLRVYIHVYASRGPLELLRQ